MKIPKYYCTNCKKYRSYAKKLYGFYKYNGLNVQGTLPCCPYCDKPLVDVRARFDNFLTELCSKNMYT